MFQSSLTSAAERIEARLSAALAGSADQPVTHAMRYAVSGGKRLRGFLVIESAGLYGIAPEAAVDAAAAVEALHAYSLVHDDMPCMDDDDLRRGQPTVHVKWDDGTALLTGDALQTLAFDLLAGPSCHADPAVRIDLVASLAKASGIDGMVLGQAQDIAAETAGRPLSLEEITELQANKTGALIRWSAEAGARLARADIAPLTAYSTALGLAFQIADDILDVEGDAAKTGKRVHKDAEAGKATFVSLLGLDGAKARAKALVEEAEDALSPFGEGAETLKQAARFVIARES
ncbi:farnesyl-diphosphate synthase [Rhodovulum sulfidophilum]|uniref:Polyprenyl synthetase family protein n=1 Tax=Rhodovulum visakhapatnamense TaxID=364297 RepID=A0ABS1RCN3_9RHOB|nr:farnesyl diphosphate synthase [Rhodovulum visakhapatnamense]MBL3570132.1 polyprenyl synthetase family protein [Rhodovulum visakhapatnamense]MBL3576929.1 polyprenyl synthetase family protein [Rhodovulum visakhapatnamense]OLS42995.1 farnesyl-diphosphate synthase [Rhodovulum sulfidophilum]